ncbi:D-alanyl-D-alanine carboxypeptidase family protein [Chitinimonas sp. PSY-7]|uniref:serine hydrolase n=1 Tax=Chitinimonas sp. PSY-7 TaxID=3459088 RepID=UPI00403FE380
MLPPSMVHCRVGRGYAASQQFGPRGHFRHAAHPCTSPVHQLCITQKANFLIKAFHNVYPNWQPKYLKNGHSLKLEIKSFLLPPCFLWKFVHCRCIIFISSVTDQRRSMLSCLSALFSAFLVFSLVVLPLQAEAARSTKKADHSQGKSKKSATRSANKQTATLSKRGKPALKQNKRAKVARLVMAQQRASKVRFTRVSTLPSTLDELSLFSSAALVVNATSGERIFEKNARSIAPIASITKLMTAIVTLDMQLPLHETITITDADVDTLKNSSSRLLVGTTLTRGEIMHLALMSSENRAAHALARTSPGGTAAFVARMNRTAQSLGMQNSRFSDPTGLNSANVSTAEDLIRLVQAANHYPEIRGYSTSEEYSFISSVNGREYHFNNTNPLVKNSTWQIGVSKTGYISEAGKCLVMQAVINDTPVVIVLLDSAGRQTRIGDANRIKRWLESSPNAILRAG